MVPGAVRSRLSWPCWMRAPLCKHHRVKTQGQDATYTPRREISEEAPWSQPSTPKTVRKETVLVKSPGHGM